MTRSPHPDAPARPLPPLSLVLPEGLPDPEPEARAHAGRLLALIGEEIERSGGAIPFSRYLELALYAPGLGYYSGPLPKLGGPGDFVTAPEVSPERNAWVSSIGDTLRAGLVLLIDYGYPRREYYHPQRANGTLMCHYRHRAHGDPLALTGLQDVTAHVDFTGPARAAEGAGLKTAGFVSQADFLLATGILDEVAAASRDWECAARASEVRRLTLPDQMGETFKVLGLTRGLDLDLLGFRLRDRRNRL